MPPYPLLEFVASVGTWSFEGLAYPDTGFEGGLCIPRSIAREIWAEPDEGLFHLADGSLRRTDIWVGEIELQGRSFDVEIAALGSRVLLGREVLDKLEICFCFGKEVRLRFPDDPA